MSIDIKNFENKIFSQNGEDGITEYLLSLVGVKNSVDETIGQTSLTFKYSSWFKKLNNE